MRKQPKVPLEPGELYLGRGNKYRRVEEIRNAGHFVVYTAVEYRYGVLSPVGDPTEVMIQTFRRWVWEHVT